MALSDELKSLSEQVKKMTTTIAKLILARSPHGTSSADENIFDWLSNGLPRNMKMEQIAKFALTSKVILSYKIDYLNSFHDQLMKGLWKRSSNGCIYPLDNCYEMILYVEINEDYKVDSEKLMEELRNFSVTRQVFDKVSEPNPSLSNNQTVSYTVKNAQKLKNGGIQADDNEICVSDSCILQEREVVSGVEQVFDEIPEPHFYPYQVQMTSINGEDTQNPTEVESIQGDHELEPAIQKVQSDHFTHKQLCAKLCTLEGSHLWDLVIIYVNRMRFSTILKSLFDGCHLSDKMPHKVDDSYGNSYSECPCSRVSAKSFVMLNTDYSSKFIENVVSPLFLSDMDWFTGSSISMILGVNVNKPKVFELEHDWRSHSNFKEINSWDKRLTCIDYVMIELTTQPLNDGGQILMELILMKRWYMLDICGGASVSVTLVNGFLVPIFQLTIDPCTTWTSIPYDPGILVIDLSPLVFTYTLEDKGVFRGEEDTNGKCTWKLLNHLGLWSKYNASRTNICFVLLSYIFDPGGFAFCLGQISMVVLHDLEIIVNQVTNFHAHMVSTIFQGLAFNNLEIANLLLVLARLGFDMVRYKHDFEELGNDMGLLLWLRMSSLICAWNHLTINHTILMTLVFFKPFSVLANLILASISCLTLEDKGDFMGEEEKVCVKYNWKLFNFMVFCSNHFPSRTNKSLVLFHVFDPCGLYWCCDRIRKTIVRIHMMTPVLWSAFIVDTLPLVCNDLCYGCVRAFLNRLLGIENLNGFGEKGVNRHDEYINFERGSKDEILNKLGFTNIYQFGHQYTKIKPEGLFFRAPANAFKCWFFVFVVKGSTIISNICSFDPGGLRYIFIHHAGIKVMFLKKFTTYAFEHIFGVVCLLRLLVLVVNFKDSTTTVMFSLGPTVFYCALPLLKSLWATLWDKYSGLQLDSDTRWCLTWIEVVSFTFREAHTLMSHNPPLNSAEVVIFVFDPGGYESGLEVIIDPRVCGGNLPTDERYGDYQIYAFDPGVSSIVQDGNTM